MKTEEKSNEITAVPELLDTLDISDAIITTDALSCQKTIAKKIADKGASYVLAVKNNQASLHDEIVNFFDQVTSEDYSEAAISYYGTEEKGHGRHEKLGNFSL
jgi:predicted transposase YbfD/YdcC